MIGERPSEAGAVKLTYAAGVPLIDVAVADTPVGTPGTVTGVTDTGADAAPATLVALMAATVKLYAVPSVRSATVQVVAGAVAVHVSPDPSVTR